MIRTDQFKSIITIINFAHIDDQLTPEEEIYIREIIAEQSFSSVEKEMFNLEFESPSLDFKTIFKSIESYEVREDTMQKLRGIFKRNGKVDDREKLKLSQLEMIQREISKDSKEIAIQKLKLQTMMEKEREETQDLQSAYKSLTEKKYGVIYIFYPILFLYVTIGNLYKSGKTGKKIAFAIFLIYFLIMFAMHCSRN